MSTASIVALLSAITALVTAVGGIIAVFRHASGPAHQNIHTRIAPSLEQIRASAERWRKTVDAVKDWRADASTQEQQAPLPHDKES